MLSLYFEFGFTYLLAFWWFEILDDSYPELIAALLVVFYDSLTSMSNALFDLNYCFS